MIFSTSQFYNIWYCEWCDSKNFTRKDSITIHALVCGACHKKALDFSLIEHNEKEETLLKGLCCP